MNINGSRKESSDEEHLTTRFERGCLRNSKIVSKSKPNDDDEEALMNYQFLPLIDQDSTTYAELKQGSKHIVDKSLLLKDLLSERRLLRICLPRRMGKTMILTMIESFFAPSKLKKTVSDEERKKEEAERRALFEDMSIFEKENTTFVSKYFMQIPVLYFSLMRVSGSTLDEVLDEFRKKLMKICQRYKFICEDYEIRCGGFRKLFANITSFFDSVEKEQMRFMKRALDGGEELKKKDLVDAIGKLVSILYNYYGEKKVMLLIDEYDVPVSDLAENSAESRKIEKFHSDLICEALKNNDQVRKAVLSGIFRREISDVIFNNDCNFLTQHWLLGYFGFSEETIDKFQTSLGIDPGHMQLAKRWYNGYVYKYNGKSCKLYNSYSISGFLNNYISVRARDKVVYDIKAILLPYWTDEDKLNRFANLFKLDQIGLKIEQMLADNGDHVGNPVIGKLKIFGHTEYETLMKVNESSESMAIHSDFELIFFSYLCHTGYLALTGKTLFIPNEEIRYFLGEQIITYYTQKFAFDIKLADKVTICLAKAARKVPNANGVKTDELTDAVEGIRLSFEQFLEKTKDVDNESFTQALLTFMSNRIYDSSDQMHERTFTLPNGQELRLDLAFHLGGVTTIIEMKYGSAKDRSAETGLGEADYYRRCFKALDKAGEPKYAHIKHFLLLGVNFNEKKKVTVEFDVKIPEDKDAITPKKVKDGESYKKAKMAEAAF